MDPRSQASGARAMPAKRKRAAPKAAAARSQKPKRGTKTAPAAATSDEDGDGGEDDSNEKQPAIADSKRTNGGTSAHSSARASLIGDRPKKLFEILTASLLDCAYDVLSLIASYDKETVILFVDDCGDFTVWSLDENQYITKPLFEVDVKHAVPPEFTFLSYPPLAAAPHADGNSGGCGFLLTKITGGAFDPLNVRLFQATSPLNYELLSEVTDRMNGPTVDGWYDEVDPTAMCRLPNNKVLVSSMIGIVGQPDRTDFMVFDLTRGKHACTDTLTVRSSQPEILCSLSSAIRRLDGYDITIHQMRSAGPEDDRNIEFPDGLRLTEGDRKELFTEISKEMKWYDKEVVSLLAKSVYQKKVNFEFEDSIAESAKRFKPFPALDPTQIVGQLAMPVTHLLPFPPPYAHVVLWVGYDSNDMGSEFGVYDTVKRKEILAPSVNVLNFNLRRRACEQEIFELQWLITPVPPTATAANVAAANWLSLIFTTSDGKLLSASALNSPVPALPPAELGKAGKIAAIDSGDSDDLLAWCETLESMGDDMSGAITPLARVPQRAAHIVLSDGTARLMYGQFDTTVTLVTPAANVTNGGVLKQVETRQLDRMRPARERKLPIEDICWLDADRIAVISSVRLITRIRQRERACFLVNNNARVVQTRIRIWDLTSTDENGAYANVELVLGGAARTKRLLHFMRL